jgi:hypothetical protein
MDDAEGPSIGGDSAEADDDVVQLAEGSTRVEDHSVRYSLAWWLSFAIPISIALVAIMGAVVGYRVEFHASVSSADDTDAQISSTYLSGHNYDALLTTEAAADDHARWQALLGFTAPTKGSTIAASATPPCPPTDVGAGSLVGAQYTVDCTLAEVFSGFALPGYWERGNPGAFDSRRFTDDYIALGNLGRDVDVAGHSAAAADQRHLELRLLWLAVLLALALALCTLALAATHHRWSRRPLRMSLLLAIPGWVLLALCSAALLVWEL